MSIFYVEFIFFVLLLSVAQSTLASDMSSPYTKSSKSKLQIIAFDFDKTCTRHLILDIYKARADYHGEVKVKLDKEWKRLEQMYLTSAKKVVFPMLQETDPLPVKFDEEGLRKFLKIWQDIDTLISNEVILSGILKGISEDSLKEFAKGVELMPGLLEVLERFKELNKPLHVISLNFSYKLIEGVLNPGGTLPLLVHTNKLVFEEGKSTGALNEMFLSAFDKEIEFQKIIENEKCGISIYIGDSYNDLLALLKADVGFIIGKSKSMSQICHNFGIKVMPYKWSSVQTKLNYEKSQPVLFSVESWQEIKDFIFQL